MTLKLKKHKFKLSLSKHKSEKSLRKHKKILSGKNNCSYFSKVLKFVFKLIFLANPGVGWEEVLLGGVGVG